MKIRNKKTISGKMLEVDYYPIFDDGRRVPTRAPKTKPSTEAQEKYNRAKAKKKIVRLVNANFDNTDFFVHPTYEDFQAPQTEEQARKDIVNYLRRIKTKRKSELKKVVWSTPKQVLKNTLVVIACVLVVGVFIWLFDFVAQVGITALINAF